MIIPAITEPTFEKTFELINKYSAFAKKIQIDFVDNTLFEGQTFTEIEKLNSIQTDVELNIHLLVKDPLPYVKTKVKKCKEMVCQIEADNVAETLTKALHHGYRVGLSLGPETPLQALDEFIPNLDFVQFMSIKPGGQGRPFLPEVLTKVTEFKKKYPKMPVFIDGGITSSTILLAKKARVDMFVVGSCLKNAMNPTEVYVKLQNMIIDKKIQQVAFLGGAAWKETDQPYIDAYNVAKLLAQNGYKIVNGGGPGVMRASTEGAHAGGGKVLAITYHPNKPKRHYEGVDTQNEFDDEVITLDYFDRTKVMLQTTQAHIVFNGSLGTLSEFGMTWISSWIHDPNRKPIILYGDFWQDFLDGIKKTLLIEKAEDSLLIICNSYEGVLKILNEQ